MSEDNLQLPGWQNPHRTTPHSKWRCNKIIWPNHNNSADLVRFTIARSGDVNEDDSGILNLAIKCLGITHTSIQNFAFRMSSVKTLSKCFLKLNGFVIKFIVYMYHLYLCLHSVRQSFVKNILENCDIVWNPSFCTFTCNEELYTMKSQSGRKEKYKTPSREFPTQPQVEKYNTEPCHCYWK